MQMTDNEIVRNFNQAKDRMKQIGVLADLNNCKQNDIRRILRRVGNIDIPYIGAKSVKWLEEDMAWEKEQMAKERPEKEPEVPSGFKPIEVFVEEHKEELTEEEPAPEEPKAGSVDEEAVQDIAKAFVQAGEFDFTEPEEKPTCFVPMPEKEKVPQIIIDAVEAEYDKKGVELNNLAEQVTKLKEMMTQITKDRIVIGDWLNSVEAE